MKIITSILMLFAVCVSATGQESDKEFSEYGEMRTYLGKLFEQQEFAEAVTLLENHIDRFPEHLMANSYNLALMHGSLEQYDQGIRALTNAHEQGVWFSKYAFLAEFWNPYKEVDDFKLFMDRNEEMRLAAQENVKSIYEVVLPENYTESKKYPLFIALHGGGGNIEGFRNQWYSEKMKKEFVTLYVQSSQIVAMNGFNWTEDLEISKKEILDAFNEVAREFLIDKKEIIIGGFSSGGVASMEVVLSSTIPSLGFIALCPGKPDSFSEESVAAARDAKVHCTLITTEFDGRLDMQKEMVDLFEKAGLEHQFIITPNTGHWFPENFDVMLDQAIQFARAK